LEEVLNKLHEVQVQRCLTVEECPTCIEWVEGKTVGSEPIINVFEAVDGQSIRDTCFGDSVTESQSLFYKECFKMIPVLFKGYKKARQLMKTTKTMHGSLNIDSM